MNLYLCEYWNPQELVTPPDPRFLIRECSDGCVRVEFDSSKEFDAESLAPRREEIRLWKFGITNKETAKKRNRNYVDTLVWESFPMHEQARLVEKTLIYLNAPFFNPDKKTGVSGEWIPLSVPAEIAVEFVNTEIQFARSHSIDQLHARVNHCRDFYFDGDPAFGYFSPRWNPSRTFYAELLDRRDYYIARVKDWWSVTRKKDVDPMW